MDEVERDDVDSEREGMSAPLASNGRLVTVWSSGLTRFIVVFRPVMMD